MNRKRTPGDVAFIKGFDMLANPKYAIPRTVKSDIKVWREPFQHMLEQYPREFSGLLVMKGRRVIGYVRVPQQGNTPVTVGKDFSGTREYQKVEEMGGDGIVLAHSHLLDSYPHPEEIYLSAELMRQKSNIPVVGHATLIPPKELQMEEGAIYRLPEGIGSTLKKEEIELALRKCMERPEEHIRMYVKRRRFLIGKGRHFKARHKIAGYPTLSH